MEQEQIIEDVTDYLWQKERSAEDLKNFSTSPTEVAHTLKELLSMKAPGPDQIQNIVLINFSRKAIVQLTYIINAILKFSYFPQQWKIAEIIPILKPGKPDTKPVSYRPISLLPTTTKVTEKIILKRLQKHENTLHIIRNEQFCFRHRHSTVQQIFRITNDIITGFNKNKVTTMLFLDMEKAFDKVWVDGLIRKLISYKYPPVLVKLIHSYMTNRK